MLCRNIVTMLIQKPSSVSTVLRYSPGAVSNLWHAGPGVNGSCIAGVSTGNHLLYLLLCNTALYPSVSDVVSQLSSFGIW